MIVLGVDPGLTATGFGVIERRDNRITPLDWGVIRSKSSELPERLNYIYTQLKGKLSEYKPAILSIETVFLGQNPRTALLSGHARGVILLAAIQAGCIIREYAATVIKQAVVGYGHASKRQINYMIHQLLHLPDRKMAADAADALAIAVCCLIRQELEADD